MPAPFLPPSGFIDAGEGLTARPLRHTDLPAIAQMLTVPEVARWYQSPIDEIADIIAGGDDHVWAFLVSRHDKPVGYIQAYRANGDAHWVQFGVPQDTYGVDLFLAEGRGQGTGPRLIKALVDAILALPEVRRIQIDPDPDNAIAIRAYAKVGFVARGGPQPGYEGDPMLYMTIERP